MSDGPLGLEFSKIGIKQFDPVLAKTYDLYVANTVLSVPIALNLATDTSKVVAWIHESKHLFKLCNWDPRAFNLSSLRRAVFPSKFQMAEFAEWMPNCEMSQLRNMVSVDDIKKEERQGEHADFFAVTGLWNPIKNQQRLLQLINLADLKIGFNFIGALKPHDLSVTRHQFWGQISPPDAKRAIARSFGVVSASLSETQNVSAIEAVMSGNPVLLSDIPAHQELRELIPNIVLFDAQDLRSFTAGYEEVLRLKTDVSALAANQKNASKYFGSEAFTATVKSLLS